MDTQQELEETLKCFSDKVNKNIKIITPADIENHRLYHISSLKFDSLIPNISRRAAYSEDNTLPRVHCSTTLMGCIVGHAGIFDTALNEVVGNNKKADYKGGYYIYSLPFEYALRPNNKLVYDADKTDEHWLIPYNRETRFYKPDIIAKFVIVRITVEKFDNKWIRQERMELAVEIPEGMRLPLTRDFTLTKGYWTVILDRCTNKREESETFLFEHKPLSMSEYENLKKEKAALLSY